MTNQKLHSDTLESNTVSTSMWSNQSGVLANPSKTETDAVLRIKQTAAYLGISEPTLWRLHNTDSTFPPKLKLASRARGYRKADLDVWLEAREVQA